MRFHCKRNDAGKPVDFVVQVQQSVPKQKYNGPSGCKCIEVYPVVMKSVQQDAARAGAYHDGPKFLCLCHGEILK